MAFDNLNDHQLLAFWRELKQEIAVVVITGSGELGARRILAIEVLAELRRRGYMGD